MPKNQQKPIWMSIGSAAKYLGISRDTLRRWEKKGKLIAFRSPTNRRYYTKKQLKMIMLGKAPPMPNIEDKKLKKIITGKHKQKTVKVKIKQAKIKKPINIKKLIKLALVGFGTLLATSAIAYILFYFFL